MLTAEHLRAVYGEAFEKERAAEYLVVDDFESRAGFALARPRLEAAARILACPLKAHPPNWQHGRVLYAAARRYLAGSPGLVHLVDIGTAKGFSALCLLWALMDAGAAGDVVSLDVINPLERVRRNTVAEVDGLRTLAETLAPWPEAQAIDFVCSDAATWLEHCRHRVHMAFVDGKHTHRAVTDEIRELADRQEPGDLVVFDDVHLPGVREAIDRQRTHRCEILSILPHRAYAVGVRC